MFTRNQPKADHLFTYHKKINLRYDKQINSEYNNYQELAKLITSEHNDCKITPKGYNNSDITLNFDEYVIKRNQIDSNYFTKPESNISKELNIPQGIKYKKKLKYKKLRDGIIRFHSQKIWSICFKKKFNLTIEPYCIFDEHEYVWLRVDKNDFEYGDYIFIELTNKVVTDWCEVNWIQ